MVNNIMNKLPTELSDFIITLSVTEKNIVSVYTQFPGIKHYPDQIKISESVSEYQILSESFIREFQDRVDWMSVSFHPSLSEDFIRSFQDRVYWTSVSFHQSLSEDFIREFQDRVDWYFIRRYQSLSGSFISEFKDKFEDF